MSYNRVVGMQIGSGALVEGRFDLNGEPTVKPYSVPEHVAAIALQFFQKHIAGNDVEHPSSPEHTGSTAGACLDVRYNGAMLALAMADVEFSGPDDAAAKAAALAHDYTSTENNLPAGVHGVLTEVGVDGIQHVIGLGERTPDALFIAASNGNMGIGGYYDLRQGQIGPYQGIWDLRAPVSV
jgi:hypothetical protein